MSMLVGWSPGGRDYMSYQQLFRPLFQWLKYKGPEINTEVDIRLAPASQQGSYLHFYTKSGVLLLNNVIHYSNIQGIDY